MSENWDSILGLTQSNQTRPLLLPTSPTGWGRGILRSPVSRQDASCPSIASPSVFAIRDGQCVTKSRSFAKRVQFTAAASSSYIPGVRALAEPLCGIASAKLDEATAHEDRILDAINAAKILGKWLVGQSRALEGYQMSCKSVT